MWKQTVLEHIALPSRGCCRKLNTTACSLWGRTVVWMVVECILWHWQTQEESSFPFPLPPLPKKREYHHHPSRMASVWGSKRMQIVLFSPHWTNAEREFPSHSHMSRDEEVRNDFILSVKDKFFYFPFWPMSFILKTSILHLHLEAFGETLVFLLWWKILGISFPENQ